MKGYAIGKDQYIIVEDDELANIAIESSHTVDIEKFVPKATIDDRYRDTPSSMTRKGPGLLLLVLGGAGDFPLARRL